MVNGMFGAGRHRYWDVEFTRGYADGYTSLSAIAIATTVGGADVSASATWTTIGGGTNDSPLANALDGNIATDWDRAIGDTTPFSARADFGATSSNWPTIVQARLNGGNINARRSPATAKIYWSDDGSARTLVASATYGDSWVKTGLRTVPEAPPSAGYYRVWSLMMLNNYGGNLMLLEEIEFRDLSGTDLLPAGVQDGATGRAIYTSTSGGANAPVYAYDNLDTTVYASAGPAVQTNQRFGLVFPTPVKVKTIAVTMNGHASEADPLGRSPKDVEIQASHTQLSWDTLNATTWAWPALFLTNTVIVP